MSRKVKTFIVILSLVLVLGACDMDKGTGVYYENPIGEMTDIGDPFVLKDEGTYYMYATSIPDIGFYVWQSDNLVDWSEPQIAYDILNQKEGWAVGDFWAPEVFKQDDAYYMTYSARNRDDSLRIAIAKSDSPLGPFIDQNNDLVKEAGSYIDGHIFKDDDGQAYLYYSKDNYENIIDGKHVSQILVQKLSDDLLSLEGEAKTILSPEQAWEHPEWDYQWNEGPFMLKHKDEYYLMYSAGFYGDETYAIGYAKSDDPMGDFTKSEDNPILATDLEKGISGPGHNSVTLGLDDETMYIVYHIHTDPENPSGDRRPAIDILYFEDDKLKVAGPSSSEQELR